MAAVLSAIAEGTLSATPCVVISNNAAALALEIARAHGVPAYHLSQQKIGPDADLDLTILETLKRADTEIVVLSGYLRKLGPNTLGHYRRRTLNIHPSLLPKHGGRGMHGDRVHEAVIAAGDRTSGATIHLVDAEYDAGPSISQRSVMVEIGDTAAALQRRIAAIEPELFVETLRAISTGQINLDGLPSAE